MQPADGTQAHWGANSLHAFDGYLNVGAEKLQNVVALWQPSERSLHPLPDCAQSFTSYQ